jgi:colanic acid biosynthesis glycosyl transferase WcaI
MKIVVWGINYAPELTGIAPFNRALCEYLAGQGHQVGVITGFPYYPEWRKREEDRGRWFRTEVQNGVVIRRCWLYVPKVVGPLRRMLHEASFVAVSLLRVLALPKPDLFVVISPPLPLGIAAWIASVVKGAPFVFHVQDLQPDAAVGLGMVRQGWLTRILYWMESFAYRRAARVSGISRGMLGKFREKGVPAEKIVYFPNGVKLPIELPPRGRFRARHGIACSDFVAMYSGNLGVKQGLDVLVEAARLLRDWEEMPSLAGDEPGVGGARRVRIVVAGDGARRAHLSGLIQRYELENVLLLSLQPEDAYREMLADADCSVITQQEGTGSFFFPSKLLTSLAVAKPVVTVADESSELAQAAIEGRFGMNIAPNHPEALARAIRSLAMGSGHAASEPRLTEV